MSLERSLREVGVLALELDAPVVVPGEKPVRAVLEAMREQRVGAALVTEGGRLAGIFTERDVIQRILPSQGALDRPVSDWMTADPARVSERDSIRDVIVRMHEGRFRHVVVVDSNDGIVACVRQKDIVAYMAEYHADRILNVPPDPDRVATTPLGA